MASACITLSYGATVLSLRGADFNDTRSVLRVQARSRTHDGELLVGDRELTILRFILSWSSLTDAERTSLELFFGPTMVNGSLNSFTYTDDTGTAYIVKLLNDALDYVNTFTNMWSVDMIFEQVTDSSES